MATAAMDVIQSTKNPKVREYRECVAKGISGSVPLEGVRLIGDALAAGVALSALYVTQSASRREQVQPIVTHCIKSHVPVFVVSDGVGRTMGDTVTPQGVFAIASWIPKAGHELLKTVERATQRSSFVVLLDGVQDPGNVGTIVRTAAALGASAVIGGAGSADFANPKVIRASMGAVFRLPVGSSGIAGGNSPDDASALLAWARETRWRVIAAHAGANITTTPLDELRWPERAGSAAASRARAMLVIGSEARGVSRECLELCTDLVHIPMARDVESLNAASAAAIMIYALGSGAAQNTRV